MTKNGTAKIDEVADLLAQIITYDLEYPDILMHTNINDLAGIYNGIGPDWMPESIREWMTERWQFFAAAALIHDYEYQMSTDKSREAFTACNERFRRNCHTLMKKSVPWYKRCLYRVRSDMLADACEKFGWSAWCD